MYSRDGPGRWAAGTAKSVRREGCMRWERCTHQLFPRGDNWHKSVLKPAAKGKMNVTLCLPALLWAAVWAHFRPVSELIRAQWPIIIGSAPALCLPGKWF